MSGIVTAIEREPEVALPGYLKRNDDPYTGRVFGLPARADIPFEVEEMAVVEFYAR